MADTIQKYETDTTYIALFRDGVIVDRIPTTWSEEEVIDLDERSRAVGLIAENEELALVDELREVK